MIANIVVIDPEQATHTTLRNTTSCMLFAITAGESGWNDYSAHLATLSHGN